jgi:predicted DNA-binding WGR domain protein
MKLIQQTVLVHREGRSEKVYEVDLCEVGQDRYVVNFRYGRRGSALKHGSKTVAAVSRAEAQAAFDKLVSDKIEQGYRRADEAAARPSEEPRATAAAAPPLAAAPEEPRRPETGLDPRRRAVLARLASTRAPGRRTDRWPLERAIWRAGELELREAAPRLIELLGSGGALRDYTIAWALGRCGDPSAIEPLSRLRAHPPSESAGVIAGEALLRLLDEEGRSRLRAERLEELPPALRQAVRDGSAEAASRALGELVAAGDVNGSAALEALYFAGDERVRPALLEALRTMPLKRGLFRAARRIFKAAEYRRDAEVFGILAWRFEKTPAAYRRQSRNDRRARAGGAAYGNETRRYLRMRVWRMLRRLGKLGDPDYVKMAVGVLLPVTDADARQTRVLDRYVRLAPGRIPRDRHIHYEQRRIHWDAFGHLWAFNHILYRNSPRYELRPHVTTWSCRPPFEPGQPEPAAREEAFPELWEKRPQGLLHLLDESRCAPVHSFAVKALRACREFCATLDVPVAILLLQRPYEVTARFGAELAERLYDRARPDLDLLLALAGCAWQPGRLLAQRWIEERRPVFLADSGFLAALARGGHADSRGFARQLLGSPGLSAETARAVCALLAAELSSLSLDQAELAADVVTTLREALPGPLRQMELSALLDLIECAHEPARVLGLELLAQRPDTEMLEPGTLLRLAAHRFEDVRQAALAAVRRLAGQPEAAERFAAIPAEMLWKLLKDPAREAQEIGGLLLPYHPDADRLELDRLAELADHEILSVRQAAWGILGRNVPRLRQDVAGALRLLDSKWDDSRQAAFHLLRESFTDAELTPAVLVGLCDSVREDVQRFGQEMITRHFREESGPQILLRLSEHPAPSLQLFATNFLERYAAGQPERIEKLAPYFTSVLSQVNRGRVAKSRVLAFLASEGLKSEPAARVAAGILARQSATLAVGDKASTIETMLRIHRTYPDILLPLRVQRPEKRKGSEGGREGGTGAEHQSHASGRSRSGLGM